MKPKAELVLVPAPAIGHLFAFLQFAKRLLTQDETLSITILLMQPPMVASPDPYSQSLADSNPHIRFIHLPHVEPPSTDHLLRSPEQYISDYFDSHKSHVKEAIVDHVLADTVSVVGLVLDFFSTSMIDVANELGVPSYMFFTCSAAFLGLMLHLPTRHDRVGSEFGISDADSVIPSYVNPVPAGVMPAVLLNREGGYSCFLNHCRRFREMKGIIVNSFQELESHALNSFSEPPPVYAVGPLLDLSSRTAAGADHGKILRWLDQQPPSSVVFLCFGSMGSFSPPQLGEIAAGLERSGHRFLWSIRQPPPKDEFGAPSDCGGDYDGMLPEGFLKRTEGRGMVCGWAPQVTVLAHGAVGGFVSHCGWNSTLESIWHGVPMATWPIYAEQQINAFQLVKDLEVAVELKLDYRDNPWGCGRGGGEEIVKAEEIKTAIRNLMEEKNPVRENLGKMGEESRKALIDSGSSSTSLKTLVEEILGRKPSKIINVEHV